MTIATRCSRVYGTCLGKEGRPRRHICSGWEADKRDHRKLGKLMDLFHSGTKRRRCAFWHPNGWRIWQVVEQYMRKVYENNGYQEVKGPQILDRTLWEKSGHWENYKTTCSRPSPRSGPTPVKPMNCPGHLQIYNAGLHSYKGAAAALWRVWLCHRNESSGSLHGIMRCARVHAGRRPHFRDRRPDPIGMPSLHALVTEGLRRFRLHGHHLQDFHAPEKRIGSEESWDRAERR